MAQRRVCIARCLKSAAKFIPIRLQPCANTFRTPLCVRFGPKTTFIAGKDLVSTRACHHHLDTVRFHLLKHTVVGICIWIIIWFFHQAGKGDVTRGMRGLSRGTAECS